MNWYETYIEEPIRGLVRLLRDNGINTISSCGHEMYVESEYHGENPINLFNLLYNNGYRHFKVEVVLGIDQIGVKYRSLTFWIPKSDGTLSNYSMHKGSE